MGRYHLVAQLNAPPIRVPFTAEEETARDAEEQAWTDNEINRQLKELRQKRNKLLTRTDYFGSSDKTMSAEMQTYRQELRDLTNGLDTVEKVETVVFPTKPEDN